MIKLIIQYFLRSLGNNKGISSRRLTLFLVVHTYCFVILYALLHNITIDKNIYTSLELIICTCLGVVSVSDFKKNNNNGNQNQP